MTATVWAASGAAAAQPRLAGVKVGVVTRAGAPLRNDHAANGELIRRAAVGDVLLVVKTIDGRAVEEREWHPVLLPPISPAAGTPATWRLGWIYVWNLELRSCNMVSGHGKQDTTSYTLYFNHERQTKIASNAATLRFRIDRFLLLGSPQALLLQVSPIDDEGRPSDGDSGWVEARDVSLTCERLLWAMGTELSYQSELDVEAAAHLFRAMADQYPEQRFMSDDPMPWGSLHAGAAGLSSLAALATQQQRYQEASEALTEIIERFPDTPSGNGVAGGSALLQLARLYHEHLDRASEALSICQQAIIRYPGSSPEYYEGSSTVDIEAIELIETIGREHDLEDGELLRQYTIAGERSTFPVVTMIATVRQAEIMRRQGEVEAAVDLLSRAIKRYPSTPFQFFKYEADYSCSALDLLVRIWVEDLNRPQEALAFCTDLFFSHLDPQLDRVALHQRITIMDRCGAGRQRLIDACERFLAHHGDWGGIGVPLADYREDYGRVIGSFQIKDILDTVQARPETAGKPCLWRPRLQVTGQMLIDACQNLELEIIETLLDHGADVNAVDADGSSVLAIVVYEERNPSLVRLLLERGAATEVSYQGDRTPLAIAASRGRSNLLQILLEHGANIEARDSHGRTPLARALMRDDTGMVAQLATNGADVSSGAPLITAVGGGQQAMVEVLLDHGVDINAPGPDGRTALHESVYREDEPFIRFLLQRGADPMIADGNGKLPLEIAFLHGQHQIAKLLIDSAGTGEGDGTALAPILWAAWAGDAEAVQSLIERGADVNAVSTDNVSPLMEACKNGHLEVAAVLIEHGAEVNAQTRKGWSPLMWAAEKGHSHLVRLLLDAGADPTLVNQHGNNAWAIAFESNQTEVAALLDGRAADDSAAVWWTPIRLVIAGFLLLLLLAFAAGYRRRVRAR
jgi:ankyrin repeat protein/tetratricopeptide (TPR) repeat protein